MGVRQFSVIGHVDRSEIAGDILASEIPGDILVQGSRPANLGNYHSGRAASIKLYILSILRILIRLAPLVLPRGHARSSRITERTTPEPRVLWPRC